MIAVIILVVRTARQRVYRPVNPHIDFRQIHTAFQRVPLRQNGGQAIASNLRVVGAVAAVPLIFRVDLPGHALHGQGFRFGVLGVPGRPQRRGQRERAPLRTGWDRLIFYLRVQRVKARDGDNRRAGFSLRFRSVPRGGGSAAIPFCFLPLADFTDKAAGVARHGLHIAAVVVFPALMGAVQGITGLRVFVNGVAAAGGRLRVLVVIAANQLVGVAVRRVCMAAGLALYGLHIAALVRMRRVVFTQAPGAARRPLRVDRRAQLGKYQRGAQQQRPYPFSFSYHKLFPPIISYADR